MKVDQIALLRSAGDISQARVFPASKEGKWMIEFQRKGGAREPLTAQRNNIRHFSSIDSAWKVLSTLGFAEARLSWSDVPQPSE